MPRLIIREMGRERVVEIDLDKVTIGRSKANAVPISDAKASRAHCAIQKTEQGWFVLDLGSSNGTLLNGKLVQKALLALGDVISIGNAHIHFERVVEDRPAAKPVDDTAYVAEVVEPEPPAKPEAVQLAPPERIDSLHADVGGARYLLRMLKGPKPGSTYPLGSQDFTIGRKGNNTLALDDERASGNHAQVSREGSLWVLTDLDSTNGTVVNGRRIKREILEHGAVFSIGGSSFQFVDIQGPRLREAVPARAAVPPQALEFAEPRGLPSDAEFAAIDVQKALKRRGSNALLTFLYTIAVLFLIVGGVYFAFQVFGQLLGRGPTAVKEGSLITRNPSFEEIPRSEDMLPGWIVPAAGWSIDKQNAKTGKASLKLDCSVNGNPDDLLKVDLDPRTITPDRQYQVRIQAKVVQARKAGVRVMWSDPVNPYFVQESYSELLGDEGGKWKALRWTFVPPEKATRMELSLCAFGNVGAVWFDDVELYESDLEPETPELQGVSLKGEIEVGVDPRGIWNLFRLGALTLWDGQLFLADKDGRVDAFSRQVLSDIQKRASVSGDSMLYLGYLYEPHDATWAPLTQEIYVREDRLSVRYRLSGDFKGTGKLGVSFSARPDILSVSRVEVSSAAGVQFFEDDFQVQGAKEMVWGSGESRVSFSFPEPVDISAGRTERGVHVLLTRPLGTGKEAGFAIDFSEISLRQQQKVEELFDTIAKLREAGKLQEAIDVARHAQLEIVKQEEAKKRMGNLIKEMGEEGNVLVKEARHIYDDFKKSHHPELLKNLGIVVERVSTAFPDSQRTRDAEALLSLAQEGLEKQKTRQIQEKASRMLQDGDRYREGGKLGLAAVYYEYVRDNFAGTEWEKDARAKLKQLEDQIRHEGRW